MIGVFIPQVKNNGTFYMVINRAPKTIKIHKQLINKEFTEKHGNILIFISKQSSDKKWPDFPHSSLLFERWQRCGGKSKTSTILETDLPNRAGNHLTLAMVDSKSDTFSLLKLARDCTAKHTPLSPSTLSIMLVGFDHAQQQKLGEAALSAVLAANHQLPEFKKSSASDKSSASKATPLKTIHLYGMEARINSKRILAESKGCELARSLTMLPPNKLTPGEYRKKINQLARQHGWKVNTLDSKTLKQKKAGAFLSVVQGSAKDDAAIVHIRYTPITTSTAKKTRQPTLALVGKGICYDTGGINLKPAKHMFGMHEDMGGSAVALGTLLTLSELQVPFQIDCWLALAENHIGPKAYKQNDIITAANGLNIEITHTDAEGRMVLADTLHFASKLKPSLIIDYATLTGACVYSLGTRYSGIFSNREEVYSSLIKAGKDSGERVWPFPMDDDYAEALQSDIADIKQCTLDGEADHILAAQFLKRFVNDRPWLHIDLSACNNKGGLAHIPGDTTGFGVRYSTNLLLDQNIMNEVKS